MAYEAPTEFVLGYDSLLAKFDALVAQGLVFYSPSKIVTLKDKDFHCEFRINQTLKAKPQLGEPLKTKNSAVAHGEGDTPATFGPGSDLAFVHPDIVLASINNTHLLIANLYCVCRPQLLLLTKDSTRRQHDPLEADDLNAAIGVLTDIKHSHYAMFNCTATAGASRVHKHVHILPRGGENESEGVLSLNIRAHSFPFQYYWCPIEQLDRGDRLLHLYTRLLARTREALGLAADAICPHNVILTEDQLMVIPRRCNDFHGITANGAGMIGSVWLQSESQMESWTQFGPAEVVSQLGIPRHHSG